MADNDSTAGVGEQTPATDAVETTTTTIETPAEPAGASEQTTLLDAPDPWDAAFEKAATDTEPAPETAEVAPEPAAEPEKPAEGEKPELTPEEQLLEEAFNASESKPEGEKSQEEIDKEIDKQDPQAMQEAQKHPSQKAYVARLQKYAEPLKQFKYDELKAEQVFEALAPQLGDEKISALKSAAAHDLVDTNPDATFQRAYVRKLMATDPTFKYVEGMPLPSLTEVIARMSTPATTAPDPAQATAVAELTADMDKQFPNWRDPANDDANFLDDREKAMAKTLRALEAKATIAPAPESDAKVKELEEKLQALTQKEGTEVQAKIDSTYSSRLATYQTTVEEKVLPFILKKAGLEVSPTDTPEIAAEKESLKELFTGSKFDQENGFDSDFQRYVLEHSSVKTDVRRVIERVAVAVHKGAQAEAAGNTAAADQFYADADSEQATLLTLYAKAAGVFIPNKVTPRMASRVQQVGSRAETTTQASERVEIVSNGSPSTSKPPALTGNTAEDIWQARIDQEIAAERLERAA